MEKPEISHLIAAFLRDLSEDVEKSNGDFTIEITDSASEIIDKGGVSGKHLVPSRRRIEMVLDIPISPSVSPR